ncbi:MAG: hypothetical protein AB1346_00470 [Thermodesulfobacteriota bacterium]
MGWLDDQVPRAPKREPVPFTTVEVECTTAPGTNSYRADGRKQAPGDKARLDYAVAHHLQRQGKARILPGTEKTTRR